jgi:hypothetical protein
MVSSSNHESARAQAFLAKGQTAQGNAARRRQT